MSVPGASRLVVAAVALFMTVPAVRESGAQATFHKEVMPVLRTHCISCHRVGGTAPQSFETYKEMRPWIRSTRKTVLDGSMPPWPLDPAVGVWQNSGVMTEEEKTLLAEWAKNKGPEGDPATAAPAPEAPGPFVLGTPDQIHEAPAVEVPADAGNLYKVLLVGPAFGADTWLRGAEIAPGSIASVQHATLSILPAAAAEAAAAAGAPDPDWSSEGRHAVAVWNRGMTVQKPYPDGTGVLAPAGSRLVLHIHYRGQKAAEQDVTKVGLFMAPSAPAKELKTMAVDARDFKIPADSYAHAVKASKTVAGAISIHALLPQMRYLGHKMLVKAGGAPILSVVAYSHELETLYRPVEPIAVAAGTAIEVEASYENNRDNIHNPNLSSKEAVYGPAPAGERLTLVAWYTE